MNSQLAVVILLIGGAVLVWAAIKGQDPREIVKSAVQGSKLKKAGS